jgi:hypothetical protein
MTNKLVMWVFAVTFASIGVAAVVDTLRVARPPVSITPCK